MIEDWGFLIFDFLLTPRHPETWKPCDDSIEPNTDPQINKSTDILPRITTPGSPPGRGLSHHAMEKPFLISDWGLGIFDIVLTPRYPETLTPA